MPAPELPCQAALLVPQKPPMLVIDRLVLRDAEKNYSLVETMVPTEGVFIESDGRVIPEFFIELIAQSMAAVNGYDAMHDNEENGQGVLVGLEDFSCKGNAATGELLKVEVKKIFEFGPVTTMSGKVINSAGELLAEGSVKAWELE